VNYSIEFATAGTNFAATVVATSLERLNFTVSALHRCRCFAPFESAIDVRIKSTVGTKGSIAQMSNSYTMKVTPYPTAGWVLLEALQSQVGIQI
jgi:hypothetical protein